MSDKTFHITSEDVRKIESKDSKYYGGNIPKDSDVSALKSIVSEQELKQEKIDRIKAGLPLPEQPVGGAAPDFNSMDERAVNVGSGGVNVKLGTGSSNGLREPATAESAARVDGEEFKTNTV